MKMPVGEREQYTDYAECAICGATVTFYEGHALEECLKGLADRIRNLENEIDRTRELEYREPE